jgi:ABC-2 type transport system ATP-binding protein
MLNQSKKILDGTIREIKARFRPELVQVTLAGLTQALPSSWQVLSEEEGRVELQLSLHGKGANALLTELMGYGEVLRFQEQLPSMEELFIQQVKANSHA